MKKTAIISGAVVIVMAIAGCSSEDERMKTTPEETKILNDSSQPETMRGNEQLDQMLNGFMGIEWQQTSGDLAASIKSALQTNGSTITDEKSNANSREFTFEGGNFKNIPIQRGMILGQQGKGVVNAILTLKPTGADLESELQNLITAMSAEYGKTHEKNANGVVWYFKGTESAVMEATKNEGTKILRIHARRGEGGTPYSWDKTGNE